MVKLVDLETGEELPELYRVPHQDKQPNLLKAVEEAPKPAPKAAPEPAPQATPQMKPGNVFSDDENRKLAYMFKHQIIQFNRHIDEDVGTPTVTLSLSRAATAEQKELYEQYLEHIKAEVRSLMNKYNLPNKSDAITMTSKPGLTTVTFYNPEAFREFLTNLKDKGLLPQHSMPELISDNLNETNERGMMTPCPMVPKPLST